MKEFKFKTWDKNRKTMRTHEDLLRMTKECFMYPVSPDIILIPVTQPHIELMQYTGLKDKNGVELYEDDIVRQRFSKEGVIPIIYKYYQVVFSEGSFTKKSLDSQYISSLQFCSNYYEVIGNIYENKELLEGQ